MQSTEHESLKPKLKIEWPSLLFIENEGVIHIIIIIIIMIITASETISPKNAKNK